MAAAVNDIELNPAAASASGLLTHEGLGDGSVAESPLPLSHEQPARSINYLAVGPLAVRRRKVTLSLLVSGSSDTKGIEKPQTLCVTITAPVPATVSTVPAPFPVVFMFNGFQTLAFSYKPYADRVASFGYVVVQYDVKGCVRLPGLLPIISVRTEIGFLPDLLKLLELKSATPHDFLFGLVDTSRVATMGHSRGGKLAALHLTEYPFVQTAVLFDPVDGTNRMPETVDNPSALRALAKTSKTAAVIGAGVSGQCAPVDYNYVNFNAVLANGSWAQVITQAGHAQLVDLSGPGAWISDCLCGSGSIARPHAIEICLRTCVTWLEKTFRPQQDLTAQLQAFTRWVQTSVRAGEMTFSVKGGHVQAGGAAADIDGYHPLGAAKPTLAFS